MKKYIKSLQERSHTEKSNFAFMASLGLTGVIALVWFLSIFISPEDYFKTGEDEIQNLANSGSLFDVVKAGFK